MTSQLKLSLKSREMFTRLRVVLKTEKLSNQHVTQIQMWLQKPFKQPVGSVTRDWFKQA